MSDQLNFVDYLQRVKDGLEIWKGKPHNAKWWKRIDGTPIPNDLCVCIAERLAAQPAPAVMGEELHPLAQLEREFLQVGRDLNGGQYATLITHALLPIAHRIVRAALAPGTAAAESREEPSPELLQLLKDSCDRDWKDESPEVIIRIACNALYWRDYEIAKLCEESDSYQRGYDDARRIYERKLATLRQPGESPT